MLIGLLAIKTIYISFESREEGCFYAKKLNKGENISMVTI